MPTQKIKQAEEALKQAQRVLEHAIAADLPVGSKIHFYSNRSLVPAIILAHGYGYDRVKIKSGLSGKEYWISTSKVMSVQA